jgi:serine/threonine protein kinase
VNRRFCPSCLQSFAVDEVCPADGLQLMGMPTDYPVANDVVDDRTYLVGKVADGGMSRVFTAMRTGYSEAVAIKVLDPAMGSDEPAVERYYREARMNQLLDHPNVVDVIGYGLSKTGHHTIVMELLGGRSLAQVLKEEAWLPWERAVHIAIELGDALGHAHGRRVVHRDIKPANVQLIGPVGPEEQVKLLDFGVAYYAADVKFSGPAPGSTGVSGTPAYMSPEQIQGLPLDGRSDLYALGILLFELLSGALPFEGNDPVTMCRNQLYTKPPSLGDRLPVDSVVPPALVGIVDQLLRKRRPHRLTSVGALLDALLGMVPKERWPTRLMRPPKRRTAPQGDVVRPSVHGLPRADLLKGHEETSVALLHVEVIEGDEQLLYPTPPVPELVQLFEGWCYDVARGGARLQRPDSRSVRCFFGTYDLEGDAEAKAQVAFECVESLRAGVQRHKEQTGDQWLLRAGLVVRVFNRAEVDGVARLEDKDADEAYWLAREAEPGDMMAETEAAFALRDLCDIEPTGDLVVPPQGRLVRCWLLSRQGG